MIRCPACASELPPSTIRPTRSVALCPSCAASVQLGGNAEEGWVVLGHQEPAPPEGLEVIASTTAEDGAGYREPAGGSTWRARLPWRRERAWYPGLMAVGTILGALSFTLGPHRVFADQMPVPLVAVFVTLWLVIGVASGWWALSLLRNHTTISIEQDRLSCRHGPIPVVREKSLPVDLSDVELFEIERRDPAFVAKNVSTPTWHVVARLVGGHRVPVITRLPEERHALWLQRKLETMLV